MSKFFINRPIVAMVIAILTVIVGAVSIASLPVAQFPQIAPPEIQVSAIYVGADAQTIEQSVATPIEQQMSGVDNMNYMYSLNATANGQMRMIVDFDVNTDPNTDLILSQSRVTQAAPQLRKAAVVASALILVVPLLASILANATGISLGALCMVPAFVLAARAALFETEDKTAQAQSRA